MNRKEHDEAVAELQNAFATLNKIGSLTASIKEFAEAVEKDPSLLETPPSSDAASLYREAYYAGMADGPVPGTD